MYGPYFNWQADPVGRHPARHSTLNVRCGPRLTAALRAWSDALRVEEHELVLRVLSESVARGLREGLRDAEGDWLGWGTELVRQASERHGVPPPNGIRDWLGWWDPRVDRAPLQSTSATANARPVADGD